MKTTRAVIKGDYVAQQDCAVAIVAAQFNEVIVQQLQNAAVDTLQRLGIHADNITVVQVPGAFELPLAAKKCAKSGRYRGIIALGAVIRGATAHFDHICNAANAGLAEVALQTEIPIANGVLTTETIEQAVERSGSKAGNKGADCARVVVEMINLIQALEVH